MAGRKQFDVDEALRRAMHVFWRWGYSEASIDRLTEGTGLGRSSLYAEGQAMVRAMIDGLRAMLEQALRAAGTDEHEAAELALCTLATNKSLAVLSRAGFSSEDLATIAAAAARL
jgi:hypothetical protein